MKLTTSFGVGWQVNQATKLKAKAGRLLLHEHPAQASLWQLELVEELLKEPGVGKATCDQCQFEAPVRKRTTLRSTPEELHDLFDGRW